MQGRWTVTEREGGTTELALEIGYDLTGGPVGWLVERIVSRIIGGNMQATLLAAKRILADEERGAGQLQKRSSSSGSKR